VKIAKRITAFCLALVMSLGLVSVVELAVDIPGLSPLPVAASPIARDGHTLVPTSFGQTGVGTTSHFVLTSPVDSLPNITIDGQPNPAITRREAYTFNIAPAVTLRANTVYIFRLHRDGYADVTWAFQTAKNFEILSTLPGHQGVNVPTNTGIEINFSMDGFADLDGYFTIYPQVTGRFIRSGNTSVFMPANPLAHAQVYTVTISAGLPLADSHITLGYDHVFSFETAPLVEPEAVTWPARLNFSRNIAEFPTFQPAHFQFNLNYDRTNGRPDVNFSIYGFNNASQAIVAVEQLMSIPSRSHFAWQDSLVDTDDLQYILSFEAEIPPRWTWQETATLPDILPAGFYLVHAAVGEFAAQMVIQITDIAVQLVGDSDKTLLWVNDMTTGRPAAGASIVDSYTGNVYTVDESGIAIINRAVGDGRGDNITITFEGNQCIMLFARNPRFGQPDTQSFGWGWGWGAQFSEDYWTILQLDRTLFQRNDTLHFWGFAQCRSGAGEQTRYLIASIEQHGQLMHRQTVELDGYGFSGQIALPGLASGSYNLTISDGNTTISQIFFTVDDFVKPPYQMLVSADAVAVFADETVDFTVRTEFFEGTPVSNLAISYNFWGSRLQNENRGQGQTEPDGNFTISSGIIRPAAGAQGETTLNFGAEATLPEVGRTHQLANVRVFINDIDMRVNASRDGADATVSVDINNITLDRLNNRTNTHWGDFLDVPVAGQEVSATVSRIFWEAQRTGERYCFIERRVIPTYRHTRREEVIERFALTTNADGQVTHNFTVPNRLHESYQIQLSTVDGNGRTITHTRFIGRDWTTFFREAGDDSLRLYGAKNFWDEGGYDLGEDVTLTVKRGMEAITGGRTLFVTVSGGIIHHQVTTNTLSFPFGEEHLPNTTVHAFFFNGHTYHTSHRMQANLRFNPQGRNLNIQIDTDQATYRPGDMATVTIRTTDEMGNPRPANVNLALVDEALFALRDYTVNSLNALYRQINNRLRISRATHATFVSDGMEIEALRQEFGLYESMDMDMASMPAASPMPAQAEPMQEAADDTHLRETFEDTAFFASVTTDHRGIAQITFRLPDNITSWRVTTSAVTNDLYAGNEVGNIIVTQPMFLHYSLGSTFLMGDMPIIGLNAFGTGFAGSETVEFRVWSETIPEIVHTATAAPFERVNIRLPEKVKEGEGAIIIYAAASNGYTDSVRHTYNVVTSHRLVDTAFLYDVDVDTVLDTHSEGLVNITFTDRGRGQFLWELNGMRFTRGSRLEGLVMSRESHRIISENFPDKQLRPVADFDAGIYQRPNGGIAMLPYADSNLTTTIRMMPFILDEINQNALRSYLNNIFYGETGENKMQALYGLAMLHQPVLLYLQRYAMLEDISVVDLVYVALGFAALGETHVASDIYTNRILPYIQDLGALYRVHVGGTHREIVEATSAAALLATQLGKDERAGLHAYVANHRLSFREDPMPIALNRLIYIASEITKLDPAPASITYTLFGEEFTRNLASGRSFTLRLPAQNMHHFNLTTVEGTVGAVSIRPIPLEDVDAADNNITITRQFFVAGTNTPTTIFNQEDLVRIVITVNYTATDVHGSYQITDFMPAGFAHVPNSARFTTGAVSGGGWWHWFRVDRQAVSFFDHNSRFNNTRTYTYYARIISPGTFMAQGPIAQSLAATSYLTVGNYTIITILD